MKKNAYYDGVFCDIENVRIPLSDRAVFFADGIYDAALGRNGKVFMLREHIERFKRSAHAIGLALPLPDEELKNIFDRLIADFENEFFFLYFQLSASGRRRTHARDLTAAPRLLVTLTSAEDPRTLPRATLITADDVRYRLCNIKTVNLLPAVIASTEASRLGKDEAVFIKDGIVTECAHSNIHVIRNGELYTHPEGSAILSGISRKHLLKVCHRLGIPTHEQAFTKAELFAADEVIVTSSSKIARGVSEIDGKYYPEYENSVASSIISEMLRDFYSFTV